MRSIELPTDGSDSIPHGSRHGVVDDGTDRNERVDTRRSIVRERAAARIRDVFVDATVGIVLTLLEKFNHRFLIKILVPPHDVPHL